VLLVAFEQLWKVKKNVDAIEMMRNGYIQRCELRFARRHHLRIRTVVGSWAWVDARLRAELASVIVREEMEETMHRVRMRNKNVM
jgi:hypothetical protein